ncbi:MAG: cysteine desulfurase [Bacteroidales bacterium]|nr:cysteine desulfurase [Bacteroidales bacterium]
MSFDILHIRHDFPILDVTVHDKQLIYFDNAATTHKPRQVVDRIVAYYKKENCNIHRGVHYLSTMATVAYENARKTVKDFINAEHPHEVIFTKGATEAINLVAQTYGRKNIHQGDEIILSEMEHHSNLVPWQMLAEQKGAVLKVIPVDEQGELEVQHLKSMITPRTKLIALAHVSNVLGTINPVHRVITLAHEQGIPVLLDGAQAVPHLEVDVRELNCDFYAFSAHKLYGPMGVGVLYGKEKYLEEMPPYQGGGEMVDQVTFQKTTYNKLPYKFEAGTPNVSGVLGFEAALKYILDLDLKKIHAYERELLDYMTLELLKMDSVKIFGNAENKTAVISYNIGNIHPYDAGTIYDKLGIAVRTGHHCAQPLIDRFGVPGMIRASLGLYNTIEEIDRFIEATKQVRRMLG